MSPINKERQWTHEDLFVYGVPNPDKGRTCLLCGGDVPSGFRYQHGEGVCIEALHESKETPPNET
jgi:hypothetical protein